MECHREKVEVCCPACRKFSVLCPGVEEIWRQRCEEGVDLLEGRNLRTPERAVLVLPMKREITERL